MLIQQNMCFLGLIDTQTFEEILLQIWVSRIIAARGSKIHQDYGRLNTLLLHAPWANSILAMLLEQVHYTISFLQKVVAVFMVTSEIHVTPLLHITVSLHVSQCVYVKLW